MKINCLCRNFFIDEGYYSSSAAEVNVFFVLNLTGDYLLLLLIYIHFLRFMLVSIDKRNCHLPFVA